MYILLRPPGPGVVGILKKGGRRKTVPPPQSAWVEWGGGQGTDQKTHAHTCTHRHLSTLPGSLIELGIPFDRFPPPTPVNTDCGGLWTPRFKVFLEASDHRQEATVEFYGASLETLLTSICSLIPGLLPLAPPP